MERITLLPAPYNCRGKGECPPDYSRLASGGYRLDRRLQAGQRQGAGGVCLEGTVGVDWSALLPWD